MTTESIADFWARSTAAEFLAAISQGRVPPAPHTTDVGLTIAAVEPGRIELSWRPTPRLTNPAGIVHGGYISIALDDACGLSCVSLGDRFRPMLTLDLRLDFVRPVSPGVAYRAVGQVIHPGKIRMLADARIESPDGKLVARASGSFTPNRAFDPARIFGRPMPPA